LAKGDIARLISHNVLCKINLDDIFYHIRQVAARVAKMVLWVHCWPTLFACWIN